MPHDEHVHLIEELCARLDSGTNVGLSRDLPEPGSRGDDRLALLDEQSVMLAR